MLKRDNINNTVHDIITHLQDRFAIDVKTSDIVELFEDVKVYFKENKMDLIQINNLSSKQKTDLYIEIKNLIALLLSLRNKENSQEILRILHLKLIALLSEKARKPELKLSKEQSQNKILSEQNKLSALMHNMNINNSLKQTLSTHHRKKTAMIARIKTK